MRILTSLLIACALMLAAPWAAGAVATTVDLSSTAVVPAGVHVSKVLATTFTTVTAEQEIAFKGEASKGRKVQLQGTQDWYYMTTTAGAKIFVTAKQTETIWVEANQTSSIFVQRVTADGVVTGQIVE